MYTASIGNTRRFYYLHRHKTKKISVMEEKRILGVLITDRKKEAGNVQKVLTSYGGSIKTRLGLHEVGDSTLSEEGLILLELTGNQEQQNNLQNDLEKIDGAQTKVMAFKM
jgi:hypothetical protein